MTGGNQATCGHLTARIKYGFELLIAARPTATKGKMNRPDVRTGHFRTIDVLGALSLATDMAVGLPVGHGVRATYIGMHLAKELGMPADQHADLFYAGLLMDAGCTAWTSQMATSVLGDEIVARRELFFFTDPRNPRDVLKWLAQYMARGERLGTRLRRSVNFARHGKEFMLEGLLNTAQVAARIAGRLGASSAVQEALSCAFEQWDGSGPHGKRGGSIPVISRVLYATIFLEVFHLLAGREAAVGLARGRRGRTLDPDVVDAFLRLAANEDFWQGLENEAIWDAVRQMEPDTPYRYFSDAQIDDSTKAFADFADLKSYYSAGHSRRVAALAERIAFSLPLAPTEVVTIRRAALLHDIGLVAVPSFVLHKPEGRLTEVDWESLRLHPYHAERILARVPAFAPMIPLVAAHHERPDGQGYFRGLSQQQIPLGARVIAVADIFDELTHARPGRAALDQETALGEMSRGAGTRFDREAFAALAGALNVPVPGETSPVPFRRSGESVSPKQEWPASLTAREVQVLRSLVTGASRRAVADLLSVSEHTVRHHLEHIYGKIDVHTRVEATLFAIEHDLLH